VTKQIRADTVQPKSQAHRRNAAVIEINTNLISDVRTGGHSSGPEYESLGLTTLCGVRGRSREGRGDILLGARCSSASQSVPQPQPEDPQICHNRPAAGHRHSRTAAPRTRTLSRPVYDTRHGTGTPALQIRLLIHRAEAPPTLSLRITTRLDIDHHGLGQSHGSSTALGYARPLCQTCPARDARSSSADRPRRLMTKLYWATAPSAIALDRPIARFG